MLCVSLKLESSPGLCVRFECSFSSVFLFFSLYSPSFLPCLLYDIYLVQHFQVGTAVCPQLTQFCLVDYSAIQISNSLLPTYLAMPRLLLKVFLDSPSPTHCFCTPIPSFTGTRGCPRIRVTNFIFELVQCIYCPQNITVDFGIYPTTEVL